MLIMSDERDSFGSQGRVEASIYVEVLVEDELICA